MKRKVKALMLLGAGLCLAGATHAQQAGLNSPDLVLINGNVLTMDGRSSVVEALAVLDGKILATGSNASVKSIISTRTRVLDCPSSDNLRLIRHFEKGGSGSSGVRV